MVKLKKILPALTAAALLLSGCVDQHPDASGSTPADSQTGEQRIIATSWSTQTICDRLELDLIATNKTDEPLERYKGLPEVGTAMAPDTEAIALLEPTDVIGPDTLVENIQPAYEAAGVPFTFLDLQSVEGMYEGIAMLGEKYDRRAQADAMLAEYHQIMDDFNKSIEGKPHPKVLVLMGLPGSYIECTPNSYVGSLVELAGAENVAQDDFLNFVSWNTEELLKLDPDVILLTAHGMPDMAMDMFAEEFTTNDIWQHFRAVQEGRVYQLDYSTFNMSCGFDWPDALNILKGLLYEDAGQTFAGAAGDVSQPAA